MKAIKSNIKTGLTCALSVLLMIMLTVISTSVRVGALEEKITLKDKQNVEFTITYDDKEPTITLEGPSKKYTKDSDYDKVERKDKELHLFIANAEKGTWRVVSDSTVKVRTAEWVVSPEALTSKTETSKTETSKTETSKTETSKTESSVAEPSKPQHDPLTVASFTFEEPKDDRVKLKADVKCKTETSYKWTVSAYTAKGITGTEMSIDLFDRNCSTKNPAEAEANISKLPDGEWSFKMKAEADFGDGDVITAEAQTDKTVKVTGRTKAGDPSVIKTSADLANHLMTLDWSKIEDRYDSVIVSVTDKDGKLLVYDNVGRYDSTSLDFIANSDVNVNILTVSNDAYDSVYSFTLSYSPSVSVSIDTPEITGDLMVQISYSAENTTVPADVTINGKKGSYNFSGTGTMSLPLEPMSSNQVSVTYYINDNEQYTISKTISVQSEPATVEFYGLSDRLVTSADKIVIIGKTQPGVKLKMGDVDVPVDAQGEFSAEASLQKGENDVSFDLENSYGIHATRTIKVIRTSEGSTAAAAVNNSDIPVWLQIVFGVLVAALCFAAIFVAVTLIRRKKPNSFGKLIIIVKTFLVLCMVLFIGAGVYCLIESIVVSGSISGGGLIDRLEAGDYDGLDTVLRIRNTWLERMTLFFVLGGISVVLFVLSLVFNKQLVKLSQRPKKEKAPKPPKPPKAPKAPKAPRQSMFMPDPSMQYPQYPQYPQNDQQPVQQYPQYPQYPQNDQQPAQQYPQYPQYPQNDQQPAQQYPQYPQYPQNGQ